MCAKRRKKTSVKLGSLWIVLILLSLVLVGEILFLMYKSNSRVEQTPNSPVIMETETPKPSGTAPSEWVPEVEFEQNNTFVLDKGLEITDIGKYTGLYMEDGSNEIVSGVLMIIVKNTGDLPIQYAEIILNTESGEALFTLSTLPAGESVVLLEQNRMSWSAKDQYSEAYARNIALFSGPLNLREDVLDIQILDGAINIVNISGEDISGNIVIYYKNAASDLYYGGITYRVRVEGGMKAGEIKQIMANHFSAGGSEIMFVDIG